MGEHHNQSMLHRKWLWANGWIEDADGVVKGMDVYDPATHAAVPRRIRRRPDAPRVP
jgi:hypothetical protein